MKKVIGVNIPKVPQELWGEYNLESKKVITLNSLISKYFILDNIYIKQDSDKNLLTKYLTNASNYLKNNEVLKDALFAFTSYNGPDSWTAIRISKVHEDIYAPVMEGLPGSAIITMNNSILSIMYHTKKNVA